MRLPCPAEREIAMSDQAVAGLGEFKNALKSASIPYFFVSYARSDWDGYLERFFFDLNQRICRLLGMGDTKVSFVDTNSVKNRTRLEFKNF
jgi:hypothetical protein